MVSFWSSDWQLGRTQSTQSPPPSAWRTHPTSGCLCFGSTGKPGTLLPLVDWRALCGDHDFRLQYPQFQVLKQKGSCDQGTVSRSQSLTTDDLSPSPPEHVEGASSQPPRWPQELPPPQYFRSPQRAPPLSPPNSLFFLSGPRAPTLLAEASGFRKAALRVIRIHALTTGFPGHHPRSPCHPVVPSS